MYWDLYWGSQLMKRPIFQERRIERVTPRNVFADLRILTANL